MILTVLPQRTGVDRQLEAAAVDPVVEAEVLRHLEEDFALTPTYRCMKDVWLDKEENYSGQNGKMERRQL